MTNNYFTKEEVHDVLDINQKKIGVDIITYKILKLYDTKNLTETNSYSVSVKHRIMLTGLDWKTNGKYQTTGYKNYPVLINVKSGIKASSDKKSEIVLKRIFPKTINAIVEHSTNSTAGDSKSQSQQTTVGSSSSNVNTFGVNVSAGWFVDGPTASVGFDYSHSWENGSSQSNSNGDARSREVQATTGNEMSVKDWSAYSAIRNFDNTSSNFIGEYIEWNWGQTFPWNIFDYNETISGSNILLPESVVANLLYFGPSNVDDTERNILMPPSDLSLFGIDFTMAAEWHITFPKPLTSIEELTFNHIVNVKQASHSYTPGAPEKPGHLITSLNVGYDNVMDQKTPMDIGNFALTPLIQGERNVMGVGFQTNLFDIAPTSSTTKFKIRSKANDLLVTGFGFSSVMSAVFPVGYSGKGASLKVAFKIADITDQYSLILKHWKGSAGGNIVLTCNINGNQTVINVNDLEGQGSLNNLSQLELRNFDLKSSNFHDYLVLGWNVIDLTIMPFNASVASEYTILALSIES